MVLNGINTNVTLLIIIKIHEILALYNFYPFLFGNARIPGKNCI